MAELQSHKIIFTVLLHLSSLFFYISAYELPQIYFINCGSSSSPTLYGHQTFTGDQNSGHDFSVSTGQNNPVEDTSNSSSFEPYQSARVFKKDSSYKFHIQENGTYVVRFHFYHFSSLGALSDARFKVVASGFSLLSNFSLQESNFALTEEFLLQISMGEFRIYFIPNKKGTSFAFVNAIEVFLAPPDFINYNNLNTLPLHVIRRINVGGDNVMPNNDTLLRYWVPDDPFIVNNNTSRKSDPLGTKPKYPPGGATEFFAPDYVYQTAKEMNIGNTAVTITVNITWFFNVSKRVRHFVRVHFCDIVSTTSNEGLSFNLFIGSTAQVIKPSDDQRGQTAPFYIDCVVDPADLGLLNISVGSIRGSNPSTAFLNGVEIMEVVTEKSNVGGGNALSKLPIIIGSGIGGLILVLILALVLFICLKRKKKRKLTEDFDWPLVQLPGGNSYSRTTDKTSDGSPLLDLNLGLKVPFSVILRATKNFNKNLKIGEGGFGKVYKGTLQNGIKVAVKRSDPGHGQGLPEFHTEITVLSNIRHKNLVSLIGYCEERDEMILVYEFMEKGTLRDHLYISKEECTGSTASRSKLSWNQRVEICIGAAEGIHYLHTGSSRAIIHRDIKSTNILLDENYVAKVADFGLSRSGVLDQTHVSTEVKGSFGYLDPEYFRCLQLTQKSDVYSFGVVLLEVLCARPAIDHSLPRDQINLAEWGICWQMKGEVEKIVDPYLVEKINPNSLRKFGETIVKCLQENGVDRPSMVDVLWDLEYTLKLQNTIMPREPYEDSTTEVSWTLPMPDGIQDGEYDDKYNYSNASAVNASEVFSQLKIDEAR